MPTHTQTSILFVLTSADKTLDGKPIGWYLPEAAHPWFALRDYFNIVFASPKGGVAPLDQSSVENFKDEQSVTFLNDSKTKYLVKNTHKLSNIKEEDYVAIFVVGGVGAWVEGGVGMTYNADMSAWSHDRPGL
jgi:putative intracellular protease/amidase